MHPKNLLIAIVLAAALALGVFVALRMQTPAELHSEFVLPTPTPLPEFALVKQQGEDVTTETFEGRWSLVFFGFTHCPDICPTTLQILSAARKTLAENNQQPLPRIVLVSVDPERDTPELMAKYMAYFGDDNLGITGSLDELKKLTTGLGIFFAKQAGDAENYAVDHSAAVLLVNPEAEFHALYSGTHQVETFVNDVPLIMDAYQ